MTIADRARAAWSAWFAAPGQTKSGLTGEVAFADPFRLFANGAKSFTQYNPSQLVTRQGLAIFDKMRLDDQVKASLAFKKHAVLSTDWEVVSPPDEPEDWEPTLFARELCERIDGGLKDALLGVLTALDFGYSVTECVFATIPLTMGNRVTVTALKTRKPHSIEFRCDQFGNLLPDGLRQSSWGTSTGIGGAGDRPLPPWKFVLFANDMEFGNWYGRSDLEAAYRPWVIKDNAYKWLAMLLERHGVPPIFGLYDPNSYQGGLADKLRKVIQDIQAATMGVIPRPNKDALEFWSPQLAAQARDVFIPALNKFDADIARAVLLPQLIGFTSDTDKGSLARSQQHFDSFMILVEYLRGRLALTVTERVIKPVCDLNYPGLKHYPSWRLAPIADAARFELMDRWYRAVDTGVVIPQPEDEAHIRSSFKFPPREEDAEPMPVWEGRKAPAAPTTPPMLTPPEKSATEPVKPLPEIKQTARGYTKAEQQHDFTQLAQDLDALEATTKATLVELLTVSRDALIKFVARNADDLSKVVGSLRLKGAGDIQDAIKSHLRQAFAHGAPKTTGSMDVKEHAAKKIGAAYQPKAALRYLDAQAVQVSGVLQQRVLDEVKQVLLTSIRTGEIPTETQQKLEAVFEPYVGDESVLVDGEALAPFRLETILRTNATMAFNQGRLIEARQEPDALNGLQYSAILDERTTEVCELLDGTVFALDDPDLDKLTPPNHFNCRSVLVPVPLDIPVAEEDWADPETVGKAIALGGKGFV